MTTPTYDIHHAAGSSTAPARSHRRVAGVAVSGAASTHVRLENPWFSHILFPVYVDALVRGGPWLRDARVRALLRPASGSGIR